MAEWEEKLGAILNDPQAMAQIMSIAQSLGGQEQEGASAGAVPPDTASDAPPEPSAPTPELDPKVMEVGMRALAAWQEPGDSRSALLQALRPLMKEERRGKVDKAIQITRLSKVVRVVLDSWQGGES